MNLIRSNASSNKKLILKLKLIFNLIMTGAYLCLGLYLLIKGWITLTKLQSVGIGVLLIAYSLFRIYRIIRESKNRESDEELSDKS